MKQSTLLAQTTEHAADIQLGNNVHPSQKISKTYPITALTQHSADTMTNLGNVSLA